MAIEEEAEGTFLSAHTSAVGIHELLQLGCLFNLELNLVTFSIANLEENEGSIE